MFYIIYKCLFGIVVKASRREFRDLGSIPSAVAMKPFVTEP